MDKTDHLTLVSEKRLRELLRLEQELIAARKVVKLAKSHEKHCADQNDLELQYAIQEYNKMFGFDNNGRPPALKPSGPGVKRI